MLTLGLFISNWSKVSHCHCSLLCWRLRYWRHLLHRRSNWHLHWDRGCLHLHWLRNDWCCHRMLSCKALEICCGEISLVQWCLLLLRLLWIILLLGFLKIIILNTAKQISAYLLVGLLLLLVGVRWFVLPLTLLTIVLLLRHSGSWIIPRVVSAILLTTTSWYECLRILRRLILPVLTALTLILAIQLPRVVKWLLLLITTWPTTESVLLSGWIHGLASPVRMCVRTGLSYSTWSQGLNNSNKI